MLKEKLKITCFFKARTSVTTLSECGNKIRAMAMAKGKGYRIHVPSRTGKGKTKDPKKGHLHVGKGKY